MKTSFKSVGPKEEAVNKFPFIGILKDENKNTPNKELAVLFTERSKGRIIHSLGYDNHPNSGWGKYADTWDMGQFRKMRPGEEIIIKG
jgi:hypothetical protein